MSSVDSTKRWVTLTCAAGVIVSLYAFYVEHMIHENDDYEAMCDISETVSCSTVFSSRWGRGFGIIEPLLGEDSMLNQPNSVFGIVFYFILAVINELDSVSAAKALVGLSFLSNVVTVYLASILYFILYDLCVVCVTTYTINAILLYLAISKFKQVNVKPKKRKNK